MGKVGKQVSRDLEGNFAKNTSKSLSKFLPDLIEVYLDTYDTDLSNIVTDKDSLAKPIYFYDEYKQALENFSYIDEEDDLLLRIPTEDTFNFAGRLRFVELLVHGIAGKYLELPQEDYDVLKSKKDIDDKLKRVIMDLPPFFDPSTPRELRFYLLHTRGTLYKIVEAILGKRLVVFPFSNSAPINLFDDGIAFFEDNVNTIIEKAIDSSIKEVTRRIR
jgi:hypothetical protein